MQGVGAAGQRGLQQSRVLKPSAITILMGLLGLLLGKGNGCTAWKLLDVCGFSTAAEIAVLPAT